MLIIRIYNNYFISALFVLPALNTHKSIDSLNISSNYDGTSECNDSPHYTFLLLTASGTMWNK